MSDLLIEVRKKLQGRNLYQVAVKSGVAYNAVRAIKRGDTDPKYSTLQKLAKHLKAHLRETKA